MDSPINCQSFRRFGVEIELNTKDGIVRKIDYRNGETPNGSDHIALLIHEVTNSSVEIQGWGHNYNNDFWIVKPDSSCGIEVCTPILKGYEGITELVKVVESFRKAQISADNRCSLHVHVNIADLDENQLASVIAWYIKCEHIFMDLVPSNRKINRYCQMLGMTDSFDTEFYMDPLSLIEAVSNVKYYSLNAYHFLQGGGFSSYNTKKKTIEFRIGDNGMCLDGFAVKNWIRLLLHFVDIAKNKSLPPDYKDNDNWTGLVWLEPTEVFEFLQFDKECSQGLLQVKKWFVQRILDYGFDTKLPGVWSNEARFFARKNFLNILKLIDINCDKLETREEILYGEKYSK